MEAKKVWAIKGGSIAGSPLIKRPKKRNDAGVWLFNIGVDTGKDTMTSRLKINFPGAGFCHFPMETERGYDETYFEGLTAERRVVRYKAGQPSIKWELKTGHTRNEPFDIRNYATVALEILNPQLDALYKQLNDGDTGQPKKAVNKVKLNKRGVISKRISL